MCTVITRQSDRIRLALLLPLALLALVGRRALVVDVENLAMKAVGTPTDAVAAMRESEFGSAPRVLLLATPRAPELYDSHDERDVSAWLVGLRARPEVRALEEHETEVSGELAALATLEVDEEGRYAAAVEGLHAAALATLPPTFRLAVAGVPAVEVAIAREVDAERARILPWIALVLAAVLLAVYRDLVLLLAALLAPLVSALLLDGLQGFVGLTIDPITALLGPCLLTVGVASGVHVVERYRSALRAIALRGEQGVRAASRRAARELARPLSLTVLTTLAGFLGLYASPIPAVRRFGLLASVGIVLTVGLTLTAAPSFLRLFHRPRAVRPRTAAGAPRAADGTPAGRAALTLARWSGPILAVTALVSVAAGLAFMRSRVDNDPIHVLAPGDPVRRDAARIAERLGGSEVFELLLPPADLGSPIRTAPLVLRLVHEVSALDGVVGPAGTPRSSPSGHLLLSFLLAPGDRSGEVRRSEMFARAEELARADGWPNAAATGLAVRIARDSDELVLGQRTGVLVTLAALWVVMALGFRSKRLALLGLVPNALPLLLIQGTMGWLEMPLSVASTMIGTVMLGLVVDDTIHFLHAWRGGRGTPVERTRHALHTVGRPIVVTSVVLAAGFGVTFLGELGATREFGRLAVATLSIALLADLVLLPALLQRTGLRPFLSWGHRPEQHPCPSETTTS